MSNLGGDGRAGLRRGRGFVTGLQPKEDLLVDIQSESEGAQNKAIATDGGTYNSLIFPFVKGKPSGKASFRVTGKSCKVGIAFPWGGGKLSTPVELP